MQCNIKQAIESQPNRKTDVAAALQFASFNLFTTRWENSRAATGRDGQLIIISDGILGDLGRKKGQRSQRRTTPSSSSYIGYSPLRSLHLLKMCMLIFELRFCSTFIIDCTFCRQQVDQVQKCVDQQRCYRARTWAWCDRVGSVHTVTACIDPGKRSTVRPTHLAGR